jgi:hypothetical protein
MRVGGARYLQDRGMQIYEMAKKPAGSRARPHWYMQSLDFDKVQVIREQTAQKKKDQTLVQIRGPKICVIGFEVKVSEDMTANLEF